MNIFFKNTLEVGKLVGLKIAITSVNTYYKTSEGIIGLINNIDRKYNEEWKYKITGFFSKIADFFKDNWAQIPTVARNIYEYFRNAYIAFATQENIRIIAYVTISLSVATLAISVIAFSIILFGFSSPGIIAGSAAAQIHSSIGIVSSGSFFAFMQSIGTKMVLVGCTSGAIGGATSIISYKLIENNQE